MYRDHYFFLIPLGFRFTFAKHALLNSSSISPKNSSSIFYSDAWYLYSADCSILSFLSESIYSSMFVCISVYALKGNLFQGLRFPLCTSTTEESKSSLLQ